MTDCIHDWDFAFGDDERVLACVKCDARLDGTDILTHMTMLESDLANTRSVWHDCETTLASRDELIKRLVEAGDYLAAFGSLRKWLVATKEYRATISKSESVGKESVE